MNILTYLLNETYRFRTLPGEYGNGLIYKIQLDLHFSLPLSTAPLGAVCPKSNKNKLYNFKSNFQHVNNHLNLRKFYIP